jgi:hypothetical protein
MSVDYFTVPERTVSVNREMNIVHGFVSAHETVS